MSTTLQEITIPGWYIEFQAALLRQAPRPGEITQDIAEGWTSNQRALKENLAGMMIPLLQPKRKESQLEFVDDIEIPATTKKFVAREKFVVGMDPDSEIPIAEIDEDFRQWFLSGDLSEDPMDQTTVSCSRLKHFISDIALINEIGGEDLSEVLATEMFVAMKSQHNVLKEKRELVNFYVRDGSGILRAIQWGWLKTGWGISAFPIGFQTQCSMSDLVFHHSLLSLIR